MAVAANTLIRPEPVADLDEDDFRLDLRVVEAAHPIAKLSCDTSDGCGATCSGSACSRLNWK